MWKKLSLLLIALSTSIVSLSKDYRFSHLTTAHGLSQSEVYTFLEDSYGFMWIGTLHGLNRYDGHNFEIFTTDITKHNSLSNNTIRCLNEDTLGRIWIGTDNGLNYYDQRKELIYKIKFNTTNDKISVWSLLIDGDNLFVGTNDGLWCGSISSLDFDVVEKGFIKLDKFTNINKANKIIRSLIQSKNGGILVMTNSSVSRIKLKDGNPNNYLIEDLPFNNYSGLTDMVEDAAGGIWFLLNNNGVVRYNPIKNIFDDITLENGILKNISKKYNSISIDRDQKIWIGTNNIGLLCITYDFENDEIKSAENIKDDQNNLTDLNSNLIYSTYISNKNKLWVGTIGSGVNILDQESKKIQYYKIKSQSNDILGSNFIRAIIVNKDNNILIGTQNRGLYFFNRSTAESIKLGFDNESVFHISQYHDNLYFVCTTTGTYLVEINGSLLKIVSSSQDKSNTSFYVAQGGKDIYWCATIQGLLKIKIINNQIVVEQKIDKSSKPALSINNCRVLYYDEPNHQLLVGTQGGGLNLLKLNDQSNPIENTIFRMSNNPNSLSSDNIRSIIRDKNNVFWLGTYEGINQLTYDSDSGKCSFKYYTKKDGLPNNMISSIVEDDQNNLWLGTNAGLSKFSPEQELFINYNLDDGLQSNEFSEHAVFKTNNGELFFGGTNGINSFFPEDIKLSQVKSNALMTDFYLNNERIMSGMEIDNYIPLENSILNTKRLELEPKHRNIGFKFSAMIYPNAAKIKYAYMLEGFDKKWQFTDAQNRTVHYTNLQHGNYIFKVKATNPDGVWNDNPTMISIKIETPFYLSLVAIFIYIIIFIFIFIYFSHYTVINLSTKKNLLLEKEHSEKIIKLDDVRTRFFINISHDLRTPLTLISEPLKDIMTDKDIPFKYHDHLQLIKRNVKRLTDLVEQLLDFRKAEESSLKTKLEALDFISFSKNELSHFSYAATKKGLDLTLESAEEKLLVSIDPRMIAKVYFNVISNALKYTSVGSIHINIQRVVKEIPELFHKNTSINFIQIEISDTGIGISKEQEKQIFDRFYQGNQQNASGYGIGLSHAKDLIEAHKGIIEAESNPQGGTIVRFYIPDAIVENTTTAIFANNDDVLENREDITTDNEQLLNPNLSIILLVEDNIDILNYLKNSLKNSYNVLTAINGVEGLKVASSKIPDLIISDVMMPEMDGIEFCKAIKTNINTSHIPLILLTAKVDLETKYKGIETGADDYIPKPFEMEYLLIRINNLLQSRQNLRKLFQRSMIVEPSDITLNSLDEKFLKKIIEAIEENISDEAFTVNSLESILGMSHTSFYRKIKTITGQSSQEFLVTFRIKRAYQILSENKDIRISEVAFMVGFSSFSYFSKCFKDYFGFNPSDIKNRTNNN